MNKIKIWMGETKCSCSDDKSVKKNKDPEEIY